MKAQAWRLAQWLHRTLGPIEEDRERARLLLDRQNVIGVEGVVIGFVIWVTCGLLGSNVYNFVAFAGVLALSYWGQPRPAATANWAAVIMVVLGLVWLALFLSVGGLLAVALAVRELL